MNHQKFKHKAIKYLIVMFLGEMAVKYLQFAVIAELIIWKPWFQYLLASIVTIILMLGLGTLAEAIRLFFRNRRHKKTGQLSDKIGPFWFELIESAFAFWILYSIAMVLLAFYTYRM